MGSRKEVEKKVMASSKDKRESAGDDWEKVVLKKLKTAHEATGRLGCLLGTAVTWDDGSALEMSTKLLQTILHGTEAGFSLLQAPRRGQRKQQQEIVSESLTVNPYADGHAWKKYGEKDIKDAIFRREYYRCSDEGCPATKTVEKKYEGYPPRFWVAYKNDHTCIRTNVVTFKQPSTTVGSIPCNIPVVKLPQLISFEQQESNQLPKIFAPFAPPGSSWEQNISDAMHSTKRHDALYEEHGLVDFATFEEWHQELLKPFTPLEEEDDDVYTKMFAPPPRDATPLGTFTSQQAAGCGGMYEEAINTLAGSQRGI